MTVACFFLSHEPPTQSTSKTKSKWWCSGQKLNQSGGVPGTPRLDDREDIAGDVRWRRGEVDRR